MIRCLQFLQNYKIKMIGSRTRTIVHFFRFNFQFITEIVAKFPPLFPNRFFPLSTYCKCNDFPLFCRRYISRSQTSNIAILSSLLLLFPPPSASAAVRQGERGQGDRERERETDLPRPRALSPSAAAAAAAAPVTAAAFAKGGTGAANIPPRTVQ